MTRYLVGRVYCILFGSLIFVSDGVPSSLIELREDLEVSFICALRFNIRSVLYMPM